MGLRLFLKGFLTYGVRALRGKALALVLMGAPAWAEPVTVLAFGDSLTQGYGLPAEDGFVPKLQDWLVAHGDEVTLINGGVSGDTTAGGAARVEWSLTPEVDAMIVALGGNDVLRGIAPEIARTNLTSILEVAASRDLPVLLVGLPAPGNYGAQYKAAFDAIYPDLAEQFDVLYLQSFFTGLGEGQPSELQEFFQADGIHPNAEGVTQIVEGMGPIVQELIGEIE
ncbi:arylesterase [Roseovarius rhodophyticola]|uniref:Arylesterase n=1 Tax=Roseovarius rhodophyticola TaxID=3080827 RepID=A0ABZ2TBM8_9RHOB|nr:arylesterase [Roseovarius sp. W115]MDV2930821.1 arylesterase [Roseovarius sp. W115]